MIIDEKEMKLSQTYRADSAPHETKSALRGVMQRLGLTLLACALGIGVTEAQQAATPIEVSSESSSHLMVSRLTL
jgi:hypothetical protein